MSENSQGKAIVTSMSESENLEKQFKEEGMELKSHSSYDGDKQVYMSDFSLEGLDKLRPVQEITYEKVTDQRKLGHPPIPKLNFTSEPVMHEKGQSQTRKAKDKQNIGYGDSSLMKIQGSDKFSLNLNSLNYNNSNTGKTSDKNTSRKGGARKESARYSHCYDDTERIAIVYADPEDALQANLSPLPENPADELLVQEATPQTTDLDDSELFNDKFQAMQLHRQAQQNCFTISQNQHNRTNSEAIHRPYNDLSTIMECGHDSCTAKQLPSSGSKTCGDNTTNNHSILRKIINTTTVEEKEKRTPQTITQLINQQHSNASGQKQLQSLSQDDDFGDAESALFVQNHNLSHNQQDDYQENIPVTMRAEQTLSQFTVYQNTGNFTSTQRRNPLLEEDFDRVGDDLDLQAQLNLESRPHTGRASSVGRSLRSKSNHYPSQERKNFRDYGEGHEDFIIEQPGDTSAFYNDNSGLNLVGILNKEHSTNSKSKLHHSQLLLSAQSAATPDSPLQDQSVSINSQNRGSWFFQNHQGKLSKPKQEQRRCEDDAWQERKANLMGTAKFGGQRKGKSALMDDEERDEIADLGQFTGESDQFDWRSVRQSEQEKQEDGKIICRCQGEKKCSKHDAVIVVPHFQRKDPSSINEASNFIQTLSSDLAGSLKSHAKLGSLKVKEVANQCTMGVNYFNSEEKELLRDQALKLEESLLIDDNSGKNNLHASQITLDHAVNNLDDDNFLLSDLNYPMSAVLKQQNNNQRKPQESTDLSKQSNKQSSAHSFATKIPQNNNFAFQKSLSTTSTPSLNSSAFRKDNRPNHHHPLLPKPETTTQLQLKQIADKTQERTEMELDVRDQNYNNCRRLEINEGEEMRNSFSRILSDVKNNQLNSQIDACSVAGGGGGVKQQAGYKSMSHHQDRRLMRNLQWKHGKENKLNEGESVVVGLMNDAGCQPGHPQTSNKVPEHFHTLPLSKASDLSSQPPILLQNNNRHCANHLHQTKQLQASQTSQKQDLAQRHTQHYQQQHGRRRATQIRQQQRQSPIPISAVNPNRNNTHNKYNSDATRHEAGMKIQKDQKFQNDYKSQFLQVDRQGCLQQQVISNSDIDTQLLASMDNFAQEMDMEQQLDLLTNPKQVYSNMNKYGFQTDEEKMMKSIGRVKRKLDFEQVSNRGDGGVIPGFQGKSEEKVIKCFTAGKKVAKQSELEKLVLSNIDSKKKERKVVKCATFNLDNLDAISRDSKSRASTTQHHNTSFQGYRGMTKNALMDVIHGLHRENDRCRSQLVETLKEKKLTEQQLVAQVYENGELKSNNALLADDLRRTSLSHHPMRSRQVKEVQEITPVVVLSKLGESPEIKPQRELNKSKRVDTEVQTSLDAKQVEQSNQKCNYKVSPSGHCLPCEQKLDLKVQEITNESLQDIGFKNHGKQIDQSALNEPSLAHDVPAEKQLSLTTLPIQQQTADISPLTSKTLALQLKTAQLALQMAEQKLKTQQRISQKKSSVFNGIMEHEKVMSSRLVWEGKQLRLLQLIAVCLFIVRIVSALYYFYFGTALMIRLDTTSLFN